MESLEFFLMGEEEIISQSVCHVTNTSMYRFDNPSPNGLMDARMGTTDRRYRCGTCKRGLSCPGHFGHMTFGGKKFYHPGHLSSLIKILRCVCPFCSRLLLLDDMRLSDEVLSGMHDKKRLNYISSICKSVRRCPYDDCGIDQPLKIQKTEVGLYATWNSKSESTFEDEEEFEHAKKSYSSPERVQQILQHISHNDLKIMGFNPTVSHPKNIIISVLAVPPVQLRPSIMKSDCSKMRGEDDLTVKLLDILRVSSLLKGAILDGDEKKQEEYCELIQQHLLIYLHHDSKGVITRNLRKRKNGSRGKERNICERLRGKKGRVRGNMSGKRVNQCARAVVSPDPTHNIWQLGIPETVANILTKPIVVNATNRSMLHKAVMLGKNVRNGVASVETVDGEKYDMSTLDLQQREDLYLENGMIVHRHLRDGDWVLFNRQPTLHRSSMMGHEIYIHKDRTFRLNLSCCTAYNADFDGDEMNLHSLQSYMADAEIRSVMSVPANIIDPQNSKPIISLIMDSLLAAHFITQRSTLFTRRKMMQLMIHLQFPRFQDGTVLPPPAIEYPEQRWSGKQVLQLLIPHTVYMVRRVRQCPPGASPFDDRLVIIRGGQLLNGTLGKETMKTSSGSLIHIINNDVGSREAAEFLSDCQRVFRQYMRWRGFSVGLKDCLAAPETVDTVTRSLSRCEEVANNVQSMSLSPELCENTALSIVSGMLNKLGGILQTNMTDANSFHAMLTSGSKGSIINISQIAGSVGQQNVGGSRIVPKKSEQRTLPCFAKGETSIESLGFIKNSYVTGITFPEFFFHAMGGREGLCNTAVKTATTGYIQRRMVKSLESLGVHYDNTIRNGDGYVVQFTYGGDGFNPCCIEKISLPTFDMSNEQLLRRFTVNDWGDLHAAKWRCVERKQLDILLKDRDNMRSAQPYNLKVDGKVYSIVNPYRILVRASQQKIFQRTEFTVPATFTEHWKWFLKDLHKSSYDPNTTLSKVLPLIRSHCTLKQVIFEHRLSVQQWQWALSEMYRYLIIGRVAPGEMVGSIAATSLGEPTTQLTLNSVDYNEILMVRWNGPTRCDRSGSVGKMIDSLLRQRSDDVETPERETLYLKLPDGQADALTVDDVGKVSWKPLTAVTRHPPRNSDGTNNLVKITTKSGRTVTGTRAKSFLVVQNDTIVPVRGDALECGMSVPLSVTLPNERSSHICLEEFVGEVVRDVWCSQLPNSVHLDRDFGFFIGAYLAKGVLNDESIRIVSKKESYRTRAVAWLNKKNIGYHIVDDAVHHSKLVMFLQSTCGGGAEKKVPDFAFHANDTFVWGLLEAYLSEMSEMTGLPSKVLRHGVATLLFRLDVIATMTEDGLRVDPSDREKFVRVGISADGVVDESSDAKFARWNDVALDPIVLIETIPSSHPFVYDLSVADTKNMVSGAGICLRDTFHFSGVGEKNVTLGVPRISELINATVDIQTPNIMTYLKDDYSSNKEMATRCAQFVRFFLLKDVTLSSEIVWDPNIWKTTIPEHADMVEAHAAIYKKKMVVSQWVICLELDRLKLIDNGLSISSVQHALRSKLGQAAQIVCAKENRLDWVIRVRADAKLVETPSAVDVVRNFLLSNTQINGIENIETAFVKKYESVTYAKGEVVRTPLLRLDVFGTGLSNILSLPFVDQSKTYSNNIHELEETLGIEAAITVMVMEIEKVLSFDGTYIDLHHMYLLVENCFSSGSLTAMTRHGMAKRSEAPLVRASFEETTEVLFEASLFGIMDPISGVSESIMLGQKTKCGTGFMELSYDPSIVPPVVANDLVLGPMQSMSVSDIVKTHNKTHSETKDMEMDIEEETKEVQQEYIGRKRQRSINDTAFVPMLPQMLPNDKRPSQRKTFQMLTPSMF